MDNPIALGSSVPAISKPKYLVISGILTKEQPNKLEYTHGERLDLRGLVVTIFFDYGDVPVDVAFEDFESWGITTSPEHRASLSRAENHGGNVMIYIMSAGLDLESDEDDEEMQAATKLLTVERASPIVEWPEALEMSFFHPLSRIDMRYVNTSVDGEFTWINHELPLGEWGRKPRSLTFTPNDTTNYNIMTRDIEVESHFIELIWVEPGTFKMGSPEDEYGRGTDELLHDVTLTKGFYMGKYEVTQEQYQKVMGENPSSFIDGFGLPVNNVSWFEAVVFCNRFSIMEGLEPVYYSMDGVPYLYENEVINDFFVEYYNGSVSFRCNWTANGYRLPTEAQWEYACRAGTTTAYNTGLDHIIDNTGWYEANTVSIQEVGQKRANAWGFFDMHGNVAEWCYDVYGNDFYRAEGQVDPLNDNIIFENGYYIRWRRVTRGGSYDTVDLRSAARKFVDQDATQNSSPISSNGFRVIRY